jgi:glycosyltransferase involved in cell wall biosynthesis
MLLNLAAEQIRMGIDPVICSIGRNRINEKPLETEAMKRGIKVHKFRMMPGPNYFGSIGILKTAFKEEFDLLHSHGYKGNILLGFIPKRIRRIPLISTFHGRTNIKDISKLKIYESINNLSLNFIDKVILVDKALESQIKIRKKQSLCVVRNGIQDLAKNSHSIESNDASNKYKNSDSEIIEFCKGGYTIGSIGRLSEEKGFCYLIEAIHLLIEEGFDIRLIIIGEGIERNRIKSLIKELNLGKSIYIPGYRSDAKKYLPFFKMFVLPSLTEGLPITLLEAMQAGIPTVATTVGGIPAVLKNGRAGILVKPAEAKNLAKAVKKLILDPFLAEKLATMAHKIVISDFSSYSMAKQYLNIYKKVLKDFQCL